MIFFGDPYPIDNPAPVFLDSREWPTPIGSACFACDEPIVPGDRGFMMPYMYGDGSSDILPVHYECHMRAIVGSISHQRGTCSCHGGTDGEEEESYPTRRAAAIAAFDYFIANQRRETQESERSDRRP